MTQYVSCRGCLVDRYKCAHRNTIKDSISGLGLTSIRFSCRDRVARFRAGQRVSVMWKFLVEGEGNLENVSFKATVLSESKPGRFHILVDEGECYASENDTADYVAPECLIGNGFATATYSRLTALDEPDADMCESCGGPDGGPDCFREFGELCDKELSK